VETFSLGIFHMALLRLNRARVQKVIVPPWSPAFLFSAGEQGFWYDPSDLSTLFQDAAGSTPVTAVEQPVRRMLDKSGRGNHATASADARRPVLSARVNTLENTENFGAAYWTKTEMSIVPNAATPPLELASVERLVPSTVSSAHVITRTRTGLPTGVSQTVRIIAKADGYSVLEIRIGGGTTDCLFNLVTGQTAIAGTATAATMASLGGGWFACTAVGVAVATDNLIQVRVWNDFAKTVFAGDGTSGILAGGIDARLTNDGVGLPVYQRVTTSTDYDTTGFPLYLRFDGTDDALVTGNIDFSATDKVTVCAGVRKLSDAATGVVVDLSNDGGVNNNTWALLAPSVNGSYRFISKGTLQATAGTGVFAAAPNTSVVSSLGNISGDIATLRRNGAEVETATTDQGTGNYANAPLYIGARADVALRFNGRLYALIGRGALSNAATLALTETYVNGKTRAF
jgi:hypothetical protein